ncbi:MAG: hypothetical protein NWE86_03870 [Candidatus Bathyarchaeota archaeon]|nr:hypothetical protein [Candidatus Bathyarchaeota archaeon]
MDIYTPPIAFGKATNNPPQKNRTIFFNFNIPIQTSGFFKTIMNNIIGEIMTIKISIELDREDDRHINWKVKGETDLQKIEVSAKVGTGYDSMELNEEAGTSIEKSGTIIWSGSCAFEAKAIGKSEGKEEKAYVSGELGLKEKFVSESDTTPP